MNAHDAIRTDWTQERVQDRPRTYDDIPATIPCGLNSLHLRKGGKVTDPCEELFFTELGRDLHHADDHGLGSVDEVLREVSAGGSHVDEA